MACHHPAEALCSGSDLQKGLHKAKPLRNARAPPGLGGAT